jgi:hypothetical protein
MASGLITCYIICLHRRWSKYHLFGAFSWYRSPDKCEYITWRRFLTIHIGIINIWITNNFQVIRPSICKHVVFRFSHMKQDFFLQPSSGLILYLIGICQASRLQKPSQGAYILVHTWCFSWSITNRFYMISFSFVPWTLKWPKLITHDYWNRWSKALMHIVFH